MVVLKLEYCIVPFSSRSALKKLACFFIPHLPNFVYIKSMVYDYGVLKIIKSLDLTGVHSVLVVTWDDDNMISAYSNADDETVLDMLDDILPQYEILSNDNEG